MTTIGSQLGSQWTAWGAVDRISVKADVARGFCVYVAWGADRARPLYIGKSRSFFARAGFHRQVAEWSPLVEEWEIYAFPTEEDAIAVEIEAIHDLNPIYNRQRRMTAAQLAEHRAEYERKQAARQDRHLRAIAAQMRRPAKKIPSDRPISPWRRRRFRPAKPGYPDFFTPEQFEIIARVQRAGR